MAHTAMVKEDEEAEKSMRRDEEEDRLAFVWSELPMDVRHRVLAYLSPQELCRVRCTCKEWRDVIHRRRFRIMYDMVNTGTSESPVICYMESSYPVRLEWSAFDYGARMWKKRNSFPSRLPHRKHTSDSRWDDDRLCYNLFSVGGLLCLYFCKDIECVESFFDPGPPHVSSWTVWHPYRNKWKRLPASKHQESGRAPVFVHAFVSDDRAKSYKILMAHDPWKTGTLMTEIYDSGTGVWTDRAEYTSSSIVWNSLMRGVRGVLCNGVIYFSTYGERSVGDARPLLFWYDITSDQWHDESYVSNHDPIFWVYATGFPIFEWDGRLMSIWSRITDAEEYNWDSILKYFFVERDPATRRWEDTGIEIPWVKILRKFPEVENLEIVASGNHLAFTGCTEDGSFKIAVYRRQENYWRLPPKGAFTDKMEPRRIQGLVLHTPQLDWSP